MNTVSHILRSRSQIKFKRIQICTRLLSVNAEEKISIPKRIPRGPTDILRALESTVTRDPTATHYKYHDDPFLIPSSNSDKRTFALAREAGRKAAHWVREQHPELFQHQDCEPPIKAFIPRIVYNENSEVTEEDLKAVINDVLVTEASTVYNSLKAKGVSISETTLQNLLDLLCYYNSEDSLSSEYIEERWFKQSSKGREKNRKTWRDGALAEEIFISIENPNAEAYSSLIQGMAKHYQVDRAWQLFQEAQTKGYILNVDAYNAIISVASFLKEGYDLRWSFVTDILSMMAKAQVKPNLGTMNSVLEILSTMGIGRSNKINALRVLMEFQNLGIEPSLASWYFILITYCKERGPQSTILRDILPYVENKEFQIRDVKDTYFFVTAMDVCRFHLHDKDIAKRINKLLHHKNNYDLIGDSFKESIYYRHYFILMCETEPLDYFMENVYNVFVPHIYVPEPGVIAEVLKHVEMNAAINYIPKLWSDMTVFDHTSRENLIDMVLNIIVDNKVEGKSELHEQFSNVAWSIWEKIENQSINRINKLSFTGEMLGNIMMIVLRNGDFEKACMVMKKLDKGINSVVGVPKINALMSFIDYCIQEKAPTFAIQCIQYCVDGGFPEAEDMAVKLNKNMTLDEEHLKQLVKIVGDHVINPETK